MCLYVYVYVYVFVPVCVCVYIRTLLVSTDDFSLFSLQGSIDGSSWTDIAREISQSFDLSSGLDNVYKIAYPGFYRLYRFVCPTPEDFPLVSLQLCRGGAISSGNESDDYPPLPVEPPASYTQPPVPFPTQAPNYKDTMPFPILPPIPPASVDGTSGKGLSLSTSPYPLHLLLMPASLAINPEPSGEDTQPFTSTGVETVSADASDSSKSTATTSAMKTAPSPRPTWGLPVPVKPFPFDSSSATTSKGNSDPSKEGVRRLRTSEIGNMSPPKQLSSFRKQRGVASTSSQSDVGKHRVQPSDRLRQFPPINTVGSYPLEPPVKLPPGVLHPIPVGNIPPPDGNSNVKRN
jgi:hypothetical protein